MEVSVWFDVLASVATVGALVAAIYQLWIANRDRRDSERSLRAERAMRLYEEVVAGGYTAVSFHELSLYLRKHGSEMLHDGDVTWHVVSDADLRAGGLLSPSSEAREKAFANLYTVMWFFERASASLEAHVVDDSSCFRALGFHIWWWDQLLRDLSEPKARAALGRLAVWVTSKAHAEGVLDDWVGRCATDFDGGPPILRPSDPLQAGRYG
ncbi:MAG: hypothetical protein QM630_09410 [Microbacterium sp.]